MFKRPKILFMSDTAGAGAGGTEGGTTDADAAKQAQLEADKNNQQNNDDNFEEIWQNPIDDTGGQQQQQQQQQLQQPVKEPVDSNKVFNEYIEKLELTKTVDLAEISEELNQGKTEGLGNALKTVAAQTYRQAMVDMSKIIDQKVKAGVAAAVQQSNNAVQGNMAVTQMNTALSFTKNPAIAPVAGAVLSQLIKKGKSVDDAVDGVRAFFQNTSKISAKELGLQNPPRGRPGNQPFNGTGELGDDDENEIDWLETMGV